MNNTGEFYMITPLAFHLRNTADRILYCSQTFWHFVSEVGYQNIPAHERRDYESIDLALWDCYAHLIDHYLHDRHAGYTLSLALARNALMHALNGNIGGTFNIFDLGSARRIVALFGATLMPDFITAYQVFNDFVRDLNVNKRPFALVAFYYGVVIHQQQLVREPLIAIATNVLLGHFDLDADHEIRIREELSLIPDDGWEEALAALWNRLMHATNGNISVAKRKSIQRTKFTGPTRDVANLIISDVHLNQFSGSKTQLALSLIEIAIAVSQRQKYTINAASINNGVGLLSWAISYLELDTQFEIPKLPEFIPQGYVADVLTGARTKLTSYFDPLVTLIKKIQLVVDNLIETQRKGAAVLGVVHGIMDKVYKLRDYLRSTLERIFLVTELFLAAMARDTLSVALHITHIVLFHSDIVGDAAQLLSSQLTQLFIGFEKQGEFQPQGDKSSYLYSMFEFIWSLFTGSFSDKEGVERSRALGSATSTLNSLLALSSRVGDLIASAVRYVMSRLGFPDTLGLDVRDEMESLASAINALAEQYPDPNTVPRELRDSVISMYNRGFQINAQLAAISKPMANTGPWSACVQRLTVYRNAAVSLNLSETARPPTLIIFMVGLPNQGKSFLSKSLIKAIFKKTGLVYTDDQFFAKNTDTVFWDEYAGQAGIIIDDAMARTDSDMLTQEAIDVITADSPVPKRPNVADVDKKNSNYFNAKVIILTANKLPNPSQLKVADPSAFYRRLNVLEISPRDFNTYDTVRGYTEYRKDLSHLVIASYRLRVDGSKLIKTDLRNDIRLSEAVTAFSIDLKKRLDIPNQLKNDSDVVDFLTGEVNEKEVIIEEDEQVSSEYIAKGTKRGPVVNVDIHTNGNSARVKKSEYFDAPEFKAQGIWDWFSKKSDNIDDEIRKENNLGEDVPIDPEFKRFFLMGPRGREAVRMMFIMARYKTMPKLVFSNVTAGLVSAFENISDISAVISKTIRENVLAFAALAGTCLGLALWYYTRPEEAAKDYQEQNAIGQGYSVAEAKTVSPKRIVRRIGSKFVPQSDMAEFGNDGSRAFEPSELGFEPQNVGHLAELPAMRKSMALAVVTLKESDAVTTTPVVCLLQRVILIPGHLGLHKYDWSMDLKVASDAGFTYTNILSSECEMFIVELDGGFIDRMYIKLPLRVQPFPDMLHRIPEDITEQHLSQLYHMWIDEEGKNGYVLTPLKFERRVTDSLNFVTDGITYYIKDRIHCRGVEFPGACNTVVITLNPKCVEPWIGLHGGVFKGTSVVINLLSRKEIKSDLEAMGVKTVLRKSELVDFSAQSRFEYPRNKPLVGPIDLMFKSNPPAKSSILPSRIHDPERVFLKPAVLTSEAYTKATRVIETFQAPPSQPEWLAALDRSLEATFNTLSAAIEKRNNKPRLLNLDECVGTVMDIDKRSANVSSSAGLVLRIRYKSKGKHKFISMVGNDKVPTPLLRELHAQAMQRLADGNELDVVATATLKDELLKLEKVEKGDSRMFYSVDMIFNLILQRYTAWFAMFLGDLGLGYTLGHDFNGPFPRFVLDLVNSYGPTAQVGNTDVEKNDRTFNAAVLERVNMLIERLCIKHTDMSDEDKVILRTILSQQLNMPVVFKGMIVRFTGELISGSQLTWIINSLGIPMEVQAAQRILFARAGKQFPLDPSEVMRFLQNGDDHLHVLNPKYPFITVDAICSVIKEFTGRVYTNATKNGLAIPLILAHEAFDKIEWGKRSFDRVNNVVVMKLREKVLMNMPNWIMDNGLDRKLMTREVCDSALREWFYYGRERFEAEKAYLNARLRDADIDPFEPGYPGDLVFDRLWVDFTKKF